MDTKLIVSPLKKYNSKIEKHLDYVIQNRALIISNSLFLTYENKTPHYIIIIIFFFLE